MPVWLSMRQVQVCQNLGHFRKTLIQVWWVMSPKVLKKYNLQSSICGQYMFKVSLELVMSVKRYASLSWQCFSVSLPWKHTKNTENMHFWPRVSWYVLRVTSWLWRVCRIQTFSERMWISRKWKIHGWVKKKNSIFVGIKISRKYPARDMGYTMG